jgi:chromosome partitioning protein
MKGHAEPSSLGLLMVNAPAASTDVALPRQAHFFLCRHAVDGLKKLLDTIQVLKERFQPCSARTPGLLMTFVEDRPLHTRKIALNPREICGDLVFNTVTRKGVKLVEAPDAGRSIFLFAPESKAAMEYGALADEILVRLGVPELAVAAT